MTPTRGHDGRPRRSGRRAPVHEGGDSRPYRVVGNRDGTHVAGDPDPERSGNRVRIGPEPSPCEVAGRHLPLQRPRCRCGLDCQIADSGRSGCPWPGGLRQVGTLRDGELGSALRQTRRGGFGRRRGSRIDRRRNGLPIGGDRSRRGGERRLRSGRRDRVGRGSRRSNGSGSGRRGRVSRGSGSGSASGGRRRRRRARRSRFRRGRGGRRCQGRRRRRRRRSGRRRDSGHRRGSRFGCRRRHERRRRRYAGREKTERVEVPVGLRFDAHAEVDVWAVDLGLATRADYADGVALRHGLALADRGRAEVGQRHRVPVRGQDRDGLAARRHGARKRDRARGRRAHRRAGGACDVDPAMLSAAIRVGAERERTHDDAVGRP